MWLADAEATHAAGALLGAATHVGDVIALFGPLGAGKTSFARGMLRALGCSGEIGSPTYPIIIPYAPPDAGIAVWHVDLYRIETIAEIDELGLDDARHDAALIIEWPERMGTRLWAEALRIALAVEGAGRRLTVKAPATWEARCPLR